MARSNLKRLISVVGSTSKLRLHTISGNIHPEKVRLSFTGEPISHTVSCRRFSTCPTEQRGPALGSPTSEDDAGLDHCAFWKRHSGGGTYHKSARIDPTALIEAGAIVHSEAIISAGAHIGSGAVVGPSVTVGQSTNIGYNVVLSNCMIGDSCIIHNGACIGQDGFGFFLDEQGEMVKKPQILKALIGNHVEIGANTCIDRGSWRDTKIGDHTKIDNLVQIAHNVVIGNNCMLCGQVGIAGSVTIGDYVVLGGRAAIRDHISIASKVRLAGNSCVTKDIKEAGDYGGFPAVPARQWRRQLAALRQTFK